MYKKINEECDVCKTTFYVEGDDGFYICKNGHENRKLIVQTVEYGISTLSQRVLRKKKKSKLGEDTLFDSKSSCILYHVRACLELLTERFSFLKRYDDFVKYVDELWLHLITVLRPSFLPSAACINSHYNVSIVLVILNLALEAVEHPVFVTDVVKSMENGALPVMKYVKTIRELGGYGYVETARAFGCNQFFKYRAIRKWEQWIGSRLKIRGVYFFPMTSRRLKRTVSLLKLPSRLRSEVYTIAAKLWELHPDCLRRSSTPFSFSGLVLISLSCLCKTGRVPRTMKEVWRRETQRIKEAINIDFCDLDAFVAATRRELKNDIDDNCNMNDLLDLKVNLKVRTPSDEFIRAKVYKTKHVLRDLEKKTRFNVDDAVTLIATYHRMDEEALYTEIKSIAREINKIPENKSLFEDTIAKSEG